MFPRIVSSTLLFSLVLLLADVSSVSASKHHVSRIRHHQLTNRLPSALIDEEPLTKRKIRKRQSCRPNNVTRVESSTKAAPSSIATTSSTSSTPTTTRTRLTTATTKSTVDPTPGNGSSNSDGGGNGKPSDWPSATQAGAAPAATRTSAADPFLRELSKSYNNAGNGLYNNVHKGVMTYYGQGLGACGDTYDDQSFTAAVSKLMYDSWPGAAAGQMNRNPICGPFVPGRKTLNQAGSFVTAVKYQSFVNIGGDGLLNCDQSSQCHIPLTATVKHGSKSIVVRIVDRCEACALDDIDLTPAGFAALADMSLGRTDVEWFFNKY